MRFKNQFNLVLLILIFIFHVLGCDAWVNFQGKVLDENGNRISDAKIIVEQGKTKIAEESSKEDGSYEIFENISPVGFSKVKLKVSKEGYLTHEKILTQEELKLRQINVILKSNN